MRQENAKLGWRQRLRLEVAIHAALLGAVWDHFREHWQQRKPMQ